MWLVATISSKFLALSYFFDMAPILFQKVESLTFQKMFGGICHLKWYRWINFMDLAHGLKANYLLFTSVRRHPYVFILMDLGRIVSEIFSHNGHSKGVCCKCLWWCRQFMSWYTHWILWSRGYSCVILQTEKVEYKLLLSHYSSKVYAMDELFWSANTGFHQYASYMGKLSENIFS